MKKGVTTNEDLKKTYKIIQNRLPYDNVECSLKEKNQYPIVSKFHYHQGRKSSRTERMTELNSSILVEN